MPDDYDYHVLLVSPDLPGAWFIQAARQYWLTFKPIVTTDVQTLELIPQAARLAVTAIAPPAGAEDMRAAVRRRHEGAFVEVLAASDLSLMEATLDRRAHEDQRFGEPAGAA